MLTALTILLCVGLVGIGAFRFRDRLPDLPDVVDLYVGLPDELRNKPPGVTRWLTTVDHKDIGVLYIVFGAGAGLWGAIDAVMLRTELLTPGVNVVSAGMYNALFTMHGLTMLFLFVTPVLFGLANYLLPVLIGADDMAFPRINAIAFWLLPPALVLIRFGLFSDLLGIGLLAPPETGWTMYVPMTAEMANPQIDVLLLGLHLSGVSTTLGAINFIVTIFTERADDVGWEELDIFSWTMLTTAGIVLFAFPLLGSALIMLLLDRNFGTTFFAVEGGGPMLWQHLFWFFGHPEVYILVLPPLGLLSFIIPKFSGRKLFGFKFVVYSTLAIGVLSFGVWAHHMFSTGMDPRIRGSFMAVSIAIAVPSAVKTFNWITTMYNGRIRLATPMLFCVGSIANFIVGGVTGVFLASVPVDLVLHDTYYVVGHFHLILAGTILFAMFAANYYWYPLITGRMFDRRLAKVHFWGTFATVMPLFFVLLVIGMDGLPRRLAGFPAEFALAQQVATVLAYVLMAFQLVWLWNMLHTYRTGETLDDPDPWNLKETGFFTREWRWFEARFERERGRVRSDSRDPGDDD
ncbi:cbb3-type cytochrome c oxidase subunit I (plasmid) [Halorussus salilacus]|uniref:cbb3-type cytochrome c oxidase subunit I n=1 Tax=Halorussus salilacus TaxID=2953750 RepID=UPI00209DED2D|nr:cbb3-type cytochrome c oxidase subunit I [Halorussus salilacus]USZ69933.1 cbb3-type cytochrome c oxidase subunit I [Halorussus salilacus]